jgi:ferredoxin-NADP reductase/MOSC domain-containing protein YiiM
MARLHALNVGLPRDIAWQGKVVHTAIWKEPVAGRRMVRRLNIDGDGQGDLAGHGGEHRAVFVYQLEGYRYWQSLLGRTDFTPGEFGENLTVEGLPDHDVCIGDQYRIGSALFEVTQPRVTCYRIGIRMNEPRMAALLVAHDRPGFYFRVLDEGEIGAGDEIVRVQQGPGAMTVAEINALLYKPGHPPDRLAQALRIPALSAGWRSSFTALLAQTDGATGNPGLGPAASPKPAWTGFRRLRVADKTRESDTVTSLWLEAADGSPLSPGAPGQFIVMQLRPEPEAPALLRSYSLSGAPSAARYRISVKRTADGPAGAYIAGGIRIGDVIGVSTPRGNFILAPGDGPVVLLSAGIGATPVLAMLRALESARSPRDIWWIHGARNGRDHAFAEEVRAALHALAHTHHHVRYSAPDTTDRPGADFDAPGRVDLAVLAELGVPRDADFYLCGPSAFITGLTAELVAWGVAKTHIHSELFSAGPALTPGIAAAPPKPPHLPGGEPGTGALISFARSGIDVRWRPDFGSILDLAEACDVPVRWSCRTGVCHNCETALIAGNVCYQPEPIEPPANGNILICCARPQADIVVDL